MSTRAYSCAKCGRRLEFDVDEKELAGLSVTCPICGQSQVARADMLRPPNKNATGIYRYSEAMDRIVKVSDRVRSHSRGEGGIAERAGCPNCRGGDCEVCEPACGKPSCF